MTARIFGTVWFYLLLWAWALVALILLAIGWAAFELARAYVGPDDPSDILFTFVLSGSITLSAQAQGAHALSEGDAYVIPPGLKTALTGGSVGFGDECHHFAHR